MLPLEQPIRAEVLSATRLAELAGELAEWHGAPRRAASQRMLAARLAANARVLTDAYGIMADAARRMQTVTPAAEWFLDNFHVIEDHLEVAHGDVARPQRAGLPLVHVANDSPPQPRVLVLLEAFVAHTDSRFDAELLHAFIAGYQAQEPLTLSELWALPAILRYLMLENLRRLGARIAVSHQGREAADDYADRMLNLHVEAERERPGIPPGLGNGDIPPAFTARLVQRLQYGVDDATQIPTWLVNRLAAQGTDYAREVEHEYKSQVAANQTVRNAFVSLNHLSTFDWPRFVERHSVVNEVLARHPAYLAMDFETRDSYRSAIQDLAWRSGRTESATAALVIDLAQTAKDRTGGDARRSDPGHMLIGEGRADFEARLGMVSPWWRRKLRAARPLAVTIYLVALTLLTLLCLMPAVLASDAAGVAGPGLVLLALFGVFPASDLASLIVHRISARLVRPQRLPRMAFTDGIPTACRTLVAVPTLLTSDAQIAEQIAVLEQHYLANTDGDIFFALISDWRDADAPTLDEDAALLELARCGVEALNARYRVPDPQAPRFLLLHRKRQWNTTQQRWLGWERKRGKLEELNRLLLGARDTSFIDIAGAPPAVPAQVRYVMTLDADTRMPYGTVRRLVGTAAHPLNRPVLDERGKVVAGYALFQPRVTPSVESDADDSVFQRVYAGPSGLDPYAGAVSDLYQDLFDEGSYTGKGLYDVAAFDAALRGRIPPESVLSHDLLESLFARCALISDVEVFEEFPSHAEVAAARMHRWTRGDWQLLPWALGRADTAINLLGRWKLLDNLRRSLSAPATVATLVAAWSVPATPVGWWIGLVAAAIFTPAALALIAALLPRRDGRAVWAQLPGTLRLALDAAQHGVMTLCLLPHYAWLALDAIIRTLHRMTISRRHLLEWLTAAQAKRMAGFALGQFVWPLRGATVVTLSATASVLVFNVKELPWALPFIAVWWLSPLLALLISLPARRENMDQISSPQRAELREIARQTWGYFETFVTPADHHLPPDNYQEDPAPVVAHRTSPTNIGLYLLSAVAAHDLGWLGRAELAARLESTLDTLLQLSRHRGHLFNWYDTLSLMPLPPHYVSTVDSGNLAGHLLVIAQACAEFGASSRPSSAALSGIGDTVSVFLHAVHEAGAAAPADTWRELAGRIQRLLENAGALPIADIAWDTLAAAARDLQHAVNAGANESAALADCRRWSEAIVSGVASQLADAAVDSAGAAALNLRFDQIAGTARRLFSEMDFQLLFDDECKLFSIGLRVDDNSLDEAHYDLLASEARLTSFVAVAGAAVTPAHWWRLGRSLTLIERGVTLLSWSGSMFEYLMPGLVMETPVGSLLDRANRTAVLHQIAYARRLGLPWGISESAYNVRDPALTYQYKAFGAPLLGLKRGLADDTVIAPYATALAVGYAPREALANFRHLSALGARLRYGFADALDFTPRRTPDKLRHVVVRACMAHHQGMTIVALANAVDGYRMRKRFHREPIVRAADLLLQERVPALRPPPRRVESVVLMASHTALAPPTYRRYTSIHTATPACQLLSNGSYTVMVTAAGAGFSQWRGQAVTRWRADGTCDAWGSYFYLRDQKLAAVWSPTPQPTGFTPEGFEAVFADDTARFVGTRYDIESTLEILVSPEDDAELRHLTLVNRSRHTRTIDVTSYAEIVLTSAAADSAHPAFSNLFVTTEFDASTGCLLAIRHSRDDGAPGLCAAHVLAGAAVEAYETDRARFLGRGNSPRNPAALDEVTLANSLGAVLDPVFALRTQVVLQPDVPVKLTFTTVVAPTREAALALADKYGEPAAHERSASLAWTHARVRLHHLGLAPGDANLFQQLAGSILYGDATLRANREVLRANRLNARALWRLGLGGDHPIVLVRIDSANDQRVVHQAMQAHQYLREKGLVFDLVILDDESPSYAQDFFRALEALAVRYARGTVEDWETHGQIVVLRATLLSTDEIVLLRTVARVELTAKLGPLAEQLPRRPLLTLPALRPVPKPVTPAEGTARPALEFDNGIGGFSADGTEYVVLLGAGEDTPAPWVNVMANPVFGTLVSAAGSGFSWAGNSRENQLTPWSNDAVSEPGGEAFYLQDDETGALWSPTLAPCYDRMRTFECRHGQGYSRFLHDAHDIHSEMTVFVAPDDAVKYTVISLENRGPRARRLRVTAYTEWVLGAVRAINAPFVITEMDADSGTLLAMNPWSIEFAQRVAFATCDPPATAFTADRAEFIGRNGALAAPLGLCVRRDLSGNVGAGFDPCAVLQTGVVLAPGERRVVTFLLGEAADRDAARRLALTYRAGSAPHMLERVRRHWQQLLTQVQITTPDRALDLLVNRWLPYQVLSCRLWARAGFYQAGGAYGFRDQLQDALAVVNTAPALTRAHLLLCGSRQFVAGDVQHWWHPPQGRGVRTHCSDDRLWLPFAIAHYVRRTGDVSVLDEGVGFLDGPLLPIGEADAYFEPAVSAESATLFEHGARAIDVSLATGRHGLPLIGTGDWNDGMNRVGANGAGESVWLGWFLHLTLQHYIELAEVRGETARVAQWRTHASRLADALAEAWDGQWYRRAYFDDGSPLGAASNTECRIDSIAQSWSVISGVAPRDRAQRAMAAVTSQLMRPPGEDLLLLFAPPFGGGDLQPGYIRGYPPGIRENGGQYTHAAAWCVFAYALLGDAAQAVELLRRLNPINHTSTHERALTYRVEPYAIAADVYGEAPHVRRGGWSWYTGAAGWLYRAAIEMVIGLTQEGDQLILRPCIPADWPGCSATWRYGETHYAIVISNPQGLSNGSIALSLDGVAMASGTCRVPLVDDGLPHDIQVLIGPAAAEPV